MPTCTILDLIVLVNSIVNDVHKSTITTLFKVAAALRRNPFAGLDLMIRLAFLHTGIPENHDPQSRH